MATGSGAVDLRRSAEAVRFLEPTWELAAGLPGAAHSLLTTGDSVWIGTSGGLARLRRTGPRTTLLERRMVRGLVRIDEAVYALTWPGGVSRVDQAAEALDGWDESTVGVPLLLAAAAPHPYLLTARGLWQHGRADPVHGAPRHPPTALVAGAPGEWWLGTAGGLYRAALADKTWQRVHGDPVLALLWTGGHLWIGGEQGLSHWSSTGTVEPVWQDSSVLALCPTPAGALWLAASAGLYQLDPAAPAAAVEAQEATQALKGARARGLLVDGRRLWAVTTAGWAGWWLLPK